MSERGGAEGKENHFSWTAQMNLYFKVIVSGRPMWACTSLTCGLECSIWRAPFAGYWWAGCPITFLWITAKTLSMSADLQREPHVAEGVRMRVTTRNSAWSDLRNSHLPWSLVWLTLVLQEGLHTLASLPCFHAHTAGQESRMRWCFAEHAALAHFFSDPVLPDPIPF